MRRSGILFVLSAPSGGGKTTLVTSLRQRQALTYSVSCTTRAPRPGEVHGQHYHFLSRERFLDHVRQGEFLEQAEVHGNLYGTLKSEVLIHLERGEDVLVDVDTRGASMIRSSSDPAVRLALVDVFVLPPSIEELERRLRGRGTEAEEQIALRLKNAAAEMKHWPDYRYTIVSGSMEEDVERMHAIIRAEQCDSRRLTVNE